MRGQPRFNLWKGFAVAKKVQTLVPVFHVGTGDRKRVHRVDVYDYLSEGWQLTPPAGEAVEPEAAAPAPARSSRAKKLQEALADEGAA